MRLEGSIYFMQTLQNQATQFLFTEVARRHKQNWLGAMRVAPDQTQAASASLLGTLQNWSMPLDEKLHRRLRGVQSLSHLLECYLLKGVRLDSHMGLWGMLSNTYPLRLRTDIPTPHEMLDLQCQGERFVTYLCLPEQLDESIGRFKGAFEFLLHDLEHAHKFFGDPQLFRGQLTFFNCLRAVLPHFDPWMTDPLFAKDMNYLMSDMNSHPVHLFKYLKAIVLTACLRAGEDQPEKLDEVWHQVLRDWQAPEEVRTSALKINHPGIETGADQVKLFEFFCQRFDSVYHS